MTLARILTEACAILRDVIDGSLIVWIAVELVLLYNAIMEVYR